MKTKKSVDQSTLESHSTINLLTTHYSLLSTGLASTADPTCRPFSASPVASRPTCSHLQSKLQQPTQPLRQEQAPYEKLSDGLDLSGTIQTSGALNLPAFSSSISGSDDGGVCVCNSIGTDSCGGGPFTSQSTDFVGTIDSSSSSPCSVAFSPTIGRAETISLTTRSVDEVPMDLRRTLIQPEELCQSPFSAQQLARPSEPGWCPSLIGSVNPISFASTIIAEL
ncbi:unnamed protein product [Protopolystoma xenopodis]|uniref:Uncharacterized protein n=1 Tax=Protopolystoma xenopodis TaxID=117903 RepID=A0A3S5CHH8_9PLAT|nr:unnamed protein product [Protopolystoma xenopodis]